MPTTTNYFSDYTAYCEKYRGYEDRDPDAVFDEILLECGYINAEGKNLIKSSYALAKKCHEGQLRKSGKPYITHPLTIASMMMPYKPDAILVSATLLHDTVEDTQIGLEAIQSIHPDIATIVDGATKIPCDTPGNTGILSAEQARFETMRKILTASQKDIRILYLKVFDRLHNMITIGAQDSKAIERIAKETELIYTPLAKRSGLRKIYHLLRGLTTAILEPERWKTLETFANNIHAEISQKTEEIHTYLKAQNWSKKILLEDTEFVSPFSIESGHEFYPESWYAIRMVVQKPSDCYAILHDIGVRQDENFVQVGQMNDLINAPRLSGYTGLHFEVIFAGTTRVQMHIIDRVAYNLIARPDTFLGLGKKYAPALFRDFELINEATASNSSEFMERVTEHILARKIPIHSREKPLFYMPIKSTVLDAIIYLEPQNFMYIEAIFRNNEKVPFYTPLENHDILSCSIVDQPQIDKKWLKYIHSGVSYFRIEEYLKEK